MSGVPKLDELLAGGPERGTSALIVGAAGVGKITLCMQLQRRNGASGPRYLASMNGSIRYSVGQTALGSPSGSS